MLQNSALHQHLRQVGFDDDLQVQKKCTTKKSAFSGLGLQQACQFATDKVTFAVVKVWSSYLLNLSGNALHL